MEDINLQTPSLSAEDAPALKGNRNDEPVVEFKDIVNTELNRNYPTNEEAIKAVRETFKYVGKVGKVLPLMEKLQTNFGGEANVIKFMEDALTKKDPIVETPKPEVPQLKEAPEGKFVSKEQYEADMFYSKNPQLEENKVLIDALKKANPNKSFAEVMDMPEVKGIFDKAKGYDENEKNKSVLRSNPRLGLATDKITKAREASAKGDASANTLATESVIEAYGLGKRS